MNRIRKLKRTTRNLRFRPVNYDSPDERTPIKLRSQMKEISLEMTPRSTKTVEGPGQPMRKYSGRDLAYTFPDVVSSSCGQRYYSKKKMAPGKTHVKDSKKSKQFQVKKGNISGIKKAKTSNAPKKKVRHLHFCKSRGTPNGFYLVLMNGWQARIRYPVTSPPNQAKPSCHQRNRHQDIHCIYLN